MRHFQLLDPKATVAPDRETLLLAADSPNGYERHAAVGWLAERTTGEELRPLLKRANDWVPQVRHAAQSALIARLIPEYAYRLACVLDEIEWLGRLGRDNHAPFIARVHQLLLSPEAKEALVQASIDAPPTARRYVRLLVIRKLPGGLAIHLLEESLNDTDWLRRLAARQARAEATEEQLVRWTLQQSTRPPAQIAQTLLLGLVERFPEDAPPVLDSLLLSRYRALRQTAQFYARGHRSVTDYYQGRFPEPLALVGWAESGGAGETLEPFLTDPNPVVRRAVLEALGRRDPERIKPQLLAALTDPWTGPTRAVVAALSRVLLSTDEPTVQAALALASPAPRRRLLRLLAALPFWSVPAALLEAAPEESAHELERWLADRRRLVSKPTPAQYARLSAALSRCPERLQSQLTWELAQAARFVKS